MASLKNGRFFGYNNHMIDVLNRHYDFIILDSVNFAYKIFRHKDEEPIQIGKKLVYKDSICAFIRAIESMVKQYLKDTGEVFLLFDNYFSKADLKSMFIYTDRKSLDESYKANRDKDTKEFYNSLNFLRYFYLIGPKKYHTVRIDNLEADDLVPPVIKKFMNTKDGSEKTALLVTSDLDWTRYLTPDIDWLPKLNEPPQTCEDLSKKMGFEVSCQNMVMYKVLFGDPSDNIDPITSCNEQHFEEFLELIRLGKSADDLVFMSRDADLCKKYTLLADIQKPDKKRKSSTKEALVKINTQLVTAIPCSIGSLESHLTTGREAESLYKTIREAIGLDAYQKFVFGDLKGIRI